MFNPFLLRGAHSEKAEEQSPMTNEAKKSTDENSQSAVTHLQASANYLPQYQYFYTPNGPVAYPTMGYQVAGWGMPGCPPMQYPSYNYLMQASGLQFNQTMQPSRQLIDPTTGGFLNQPQRAQNRSEQSYSGNRSSQPKSQRPSNNQNKQKPLRKPAEDAYGEPEEGEIIETKISLTGLLDPKFLTEEEMQKWRAARRRNFPTRANIARKEAEIIQNGVVGKLQESELSQLEIKLRKKLSIMDYDPIEERSHNRAKRALLKRINSAKRYRTGPTRRNTNADGSEEEPEDKRIELEKGSNYKGKQPERERSRHEYNPELKGLSKAKRLKLQIKQQREAEEKKAASLAIEAGLAGKTNEEIIQELQHQAEQVQPEKVAEPKKPNKTHSALEIIQHLKSRKQEDQAVVDNFLTDKPACDKFRYHQNTLLSSLLLEDVFKERNIMLQALRYLVSNNFLQGDPPQAL